MSYKLSDLKGNVAVECHNSEEWEAVKKIIKNPFGLGSFKEHSYKKDSWGIVVSHSIDGIIGTHEKMEFFQQEEYTIIQAKDFIRDNPEGQDFKVGDWAYVMDKWDSRLTVGKVYQCNNFNGYYHFDNGSGKKDNQCWLTRERFRKAAPHEIPKINTKSEYIEKIEDLVVGKWYGGKSSYYTYEFCFAGNQGKKIKVSSYYRDGKKYGKDDDFLSFGYFPLKEIPNPEETVKQYPNTINESFKALKKEDLYNCKIDVSESKASDNQIVIPEIKKAIPNFNISIKPIQHLKLPDVSVKPKKVADYKIKKQLLNY